MKTEDRWLTDFFDEDSFFTQKDIEMAQRLIDRSVDMRLVYDELSKKLPSPSQKQYVIEEIFNKASLYDSKNIRDKIKILNKKKEEIIETANKLAELIKDYRSDSSLFSVYIPNIFELIDDGNCNLFYELYFKDKIEEIKRDNPQYFLSICSADAPGIEDVLKTLAVGLCKIEAIPEIEEQAVLQSQKFSYLDFVRALWVGLLKASYDGELPKDFRLSHVAIGIIAECVLNLDFVVSEDDVKKAIKSIKTEALDFKKAREEFIISESAFNEAKKGGKIFTLKQS